MTAKRHLVELTRDQRRELEGLVCKAFPRRRAQIWLQADQGPHGPGLSDAAIAERLGVGMSTVERARQAWAAQGLKAGLQTAPHGPSPHARAPRWQGEAAAGLYPMDRSAAGGGPGASRARPAHASCATWRTSWTSTSSPRTRSAPWSASTRPPRPCTSTTGCPPHPGPADRPATTTSTTAWAPAASSCSRLPSWAGARSRCTSYTLHPNVQGGSVQDGCHGDCTSSVRCRLFSTSLRPQTTVSMVILGFGFS